MILENNKIVHLISVHPRDDIRIFHKQCTTMSNDGFDVSLIVSDGECTNVVF